ILLFVTLRITFQYVLHIQLIAVWSKLSYIQDFHRPVNMLIWQFLSVYSTYKKPGMQVLFHSLSYRPACRSYIKNYGVFRVRVIINEKVHTGFLVQPGTFTELVYSDRTL